MISPVPSVQVDTTAARKVRRRRYDFNEISKSWNFVFIIVLSIFAITVLLPMLLIVIVSFTDEASITFNGYSFFPENWTLDGYKYLLRTGSQLRDSYIITITYTVVGTFMSLALMTTYAYVLSVRDFPLNRFLTWFLFFTMLFGGGLVPSYILNVNYLKINNSIWILLLPGMVNVTFTIILRTFIKTSVPEELFDAAKIDGAGHWRIFMNILLPLFTTAIATIALFTTVGKWNDWFTGMLYIENPKLIPLQTLLTKIQNTIDYMKQNSEVANTPDGVALLRSLPSQNFRMATTVIVVLPILIAYPFFQRFFVQGLTVGSIKG